MAQVPKKYMNYILLIVAVFALCLLGAPGTIYHYGATNADDRISYFPMNIGFSDNWGSNTPINYGTSLDPDGFDRSDPDLMARKFTYNEYASGIIRSTIIMPAKGVDVKINKT